MTQILHTLKPGGSGRGIHYWSNWLECGHKAYLYEQNKDAFESNVRMELGTAIHAWLEEYHRHGKYFPWKDFTILTPENKGMEFEQEINVKAPYIVNRYAKDFTPDFFGKVIETEMKLAMPPGSIFPIEWVAEGIVTQDEYDKPLTGLADFVIDVDDPAQARIADYFNGYHIQLGKNIIDFKTLEYVKKLITKEGGTDAYQPGAYTTMYSEVLGGESVNFHFMGIAFGKGVVPKFEAKLMQIEPFEDGVRARNTTIAYIRKCALFRHLSKREDGYDKDLKYCRPSWARQVYEGRCPFWRNGKCKRD